ncbi:MAG: hypothetical protein IIY02_01080, partial [Firmicutes bacterium]|nr:hypothetical protein [Bacillota bacterium]
MKKSSEKTHKNSRIPKIAILGGIFLALALILYGVTGESMTTYYYEPEGDIELVSVTPDNIDGVSCDTTIVLEWTHPVSSDLIDSVKIRPSARGEWFVSGNYLMFTPQQLASGEYYTVTIPKGTVLTENGDTLEKSVFFSFETEDADLRIPDTKAFDVDGRAFTFSKEESVVIPVVSTEDDSVDVTVYRADDSEAFIDTFGELFSYPSWAHLSVDRFEGDLKGFDKVSETEMGLHWKNGYSCVDLGSLTQGQYLVRLSSGKEQRDIAVTVSSVDVGIVAENGTIALWSHKNGKANDGAEVTFDGETYTLDENGFVSVPCTLSSWSAYRDPASLAMILSDGESEYVHFLSVDDLNTDVYGELILSKTDILRGDDILVSGTLFTEYGSAVNGKATLELISSAETVSSTSVRVENGFFSCPVEELYPADGTYTYVLKYRNEVISTETLVVGEESHELVLTVEKSDDTVGDGDTVTFDVSLCDLRGKPVSDAVISVNGASEV